MIAMASADICSSATGPRGVGVDHPVDLASLELTAVALGADQLDGVERLCVQLGWSCSAAECRPGG